MKQPHDNNIVRLDANTYQYIDFDDSMTPEQRRAMSDSNGLSLAYEAFFEANGGNHEDDTLDAILKDIEELDDMLVVTVSTGQIIDIDSVVVSSTVSDYPNT